MIIIAIVVTLASVIMAGGIVLVMITNRDMIHGLDRWYARHGRNVPTHVHGHPGYELSDYEAFTRALLKARMITNRSAH